MNRRLAVAFLIASLILAAGTKASATHFPDLVVLAPDQVTGEVTFKINTATNDPRLVRTCVYRVDANAVDPTVPVACAPITSGRAPVGEEAAHTGEGVVVEVTVTVSIIVGQDQLFSIKNVADVGGGIEIESVFGENSALLPQPLLPPMFLIPG